MKAIIILLSISISTLSIPVNANPENKEYSLVIQQKTTDFDAFHAHRKQDGVALAWTNSTAGVTSFVIHHSFDGYSFNAIAQVSPDPSGRNNYQDNVALPGHNYYRIGAVKTDGSIEYSETKSVRIVRRK